MMRRRGAFGGAALGLALLAMTAVEGHAQHAASAHDMRLVGHDDLQARSAYQPTIHRQGARFIAYVGHHGGQRLNPLTQRLEWNGTSVVDVTDPRAPQYLAHIPGASGEAEAGGAQMARVCDGSDLPKGVPGKTYLLRTLGNAAHEVWDVSNPREPALVTTVLAGLNSTHKNWWECRTGIAYLVSDGRPFGWRTNRMTKIYDLADPARPRFIRDFGLPGQEPGSSGPAPDGVHGPISYRNRVYFAYGTSANGILQIVDRDKLLTGDPQSPNAFAPTADNLRYPQLGRLDMSPHWGGHTSFPVLGVRVPDFAPNTQGQVRDFVVLVSESVRNECQEPRHLTFLVDVTTESRPFSVSTYQVPAMPGEFCRRGGRFGPHSSSESFTPIYYGKMVFIAYFNAGVRAVDIRDPFSPKEAAFYIPATTANTDKRCVKVDGADRCKVAIQTNNVEVDDRGLIYLVDRAGTGLDIVELTGAARGIVGLP
ncbi:MAG TPA: hypothetical protein VGT40_00695 [Methylomirabilota bacterium]|nr:hypothetical protein [Methylomirabilota bacterium]